MSKIGRRAFLKSTGAVGAAVAWQIVPRHVLGAGQTPPSEKLNVASIGVGGQGRAAGDAKIGTQMGKSGQASQEPRRMCELVWSGIIGPVREAHIWTDRPSNGLFNEYWPQGVGRPTDTPPAPAGMDWDLWIG